MVDTDYPGPVFLSLVNTNAATCLAKCLATPACVMFAVGTAPPLSNRCFLKSNIPTTSMPYGGVTSYVPLACFSGVNYTFTHGAYAPELGTPQSADVRPALNLLVVSMQCLANPKCLGFTSTGKFVFQPRIAWPATQMVQPCAGLYLKPQPPAKPSVSPYPQPPPAPKPSQLARPPAAPPVYPPASQPPRQPPPPLPTPPPPQPPPPPPPFMKYHAPPYPPPPKPPPSPKIAPGTSVLTTFAGNGDDGSSGDGGLAMDAAVSSPQGIAVDPRDGSVYIAENSANYVRLVDANGHIQTFAGNGDQDSSGDGGPATEAGLSQPYGVAIDPSDGSVYISESFGNRVRKVAPDGTIDTVIGNGWFLSMGDGGPAKQAYVSYPMGITFDATEGALYIAEQIGCRIRRIDKDGVVTTIAGSGTQGNNQSAVIQDGKAAISADLYWPYDVATSPDSIYIAEYGSNRVRKVDKKTGIITTLAGTGRQTTTLDGDGKPGPQASVTLPCAVAYNEIDGSVFIAEINGIRRVNRQGIISTVVPAGVFGRNGGDGQPAASSTIAQPFDVKLDTKRGFAYISELFDNKVRRVDNINNLKR